MSKPHLVIDNDIDDEDPIVIRVTDDGGVDLDGLQLSIDDWDIVCTFVAAQRVMQ